MTFMHKLSARLARLRHLIIGAFIAVASVVACELPVATSTGADPVTRLVVVPQTVTLHPNQTKDLMAVGLTAAGDTGTIDVSWSVTGGSILSTQTNGGRHYGQYKAGSQTGNYKAVAKDNSGTLADTATVAVTPIPVASVAVTPATLSITVGASQQLAAVTLDSSGATLTGRVVSWSSSAPSVAAVSSGGLVTGAAAGTATITATSEGQSDYADVTVTSVAAPVASVSVAPASASVPVGQTVQLTATPRDASGQPLGGRTVTWVSNNPTVATVSSTGLVAGAAVGSATITATSEGQSGSSTITVTNPPAPVASVTVTPATASLVGNQTVQLTAVPKDASGNPLTGRTVTWGTSNTGVATVSGSGLVTGKGGGSATITATSEGQSGTSTITVTAAPVASVTVSPASTDVFVGGAAQLTATPKDASGNPLTGRLVTWASSNASIAVVSPTGLVTGVTQGSATITATSEGKNGTAAITVNPLPTGQCGAWPSGIAQWVGPLPLSNGQAFYASPSGSDANPGTLAAPWKSLAKAGSLQPGQTLFLRSGTYGARGTVWTFGSNGTASGTITVAGYPGDPRPVLLGAVRMTGQYIRLTGVVLDGPTGNVAGPGPSGEAILLIMSGAHTEFSNSEVRYDYWHAGIGGDGGFDYRVIGNYVHDNGGYLGDYNDAQNNTSHGMYASPSSYGLIANNIFEHNDAKGWMARHDANHILVVNNTIVGNGRFGVDLAEQSNNIIAANNVVQNNGIMGKGGGGIQMAGTGPYWQINNVYFNNNGSDVIGGTVTNPLIANPLLVLASSGTLARQLVGDPGTDYHLLPASPAIGHADPNYALPFDVVGKCRGSNPDAGAYQH